MCISRVCLFIFLTAGFSWSACKKPVLTDTALLPEDRLNLQFTDTLTVIGHNIREDSVPVSGATVAIAGTFNDPDFGITSAGFYIPFSLLQSEYNLDFGDSPVLDSVVLYFKYSGVYGDSSRPQSFAIYEMSESIQADADSTYYSDAVFAADDLVGVIINFIPNLTDSVTGGGTKYPAALSKRLSHDFGQKFLDASGSSNVSN